MPKHISHSGIRWFKFNASLFQKSRRPLECFMSAAVTIYWLLVQHHNIVKSVSQIMLSIVAASANEIIKGAAERDRQMF